MKHFPQQDWVDYARGVASSRQAELKAHLETCADCEADLKVWQGFRMTVMQSTMQVPEQTVRTVKMAYLLHRPQKKKTGAAWASLDFDSWLAPAQAGVRYSSTANRNGVRQ